MKAVVDSDSALAMYMYELLFGSVVLAVLILLISIKAGNSIYKRL
jgi:hypothetical protein